MDLLSILQISWTILNTDFYGMIINIITLRNYKKKGLPGVEKILVTLCLTGQTEVTEQVCEH